MCILYANATLCQNFKAIGEGLSEITCYVQTNIYIFIYIDFGVVGWLELLDLWSGQIPDETDI